MKIFFAASKNRAMQIRAMENRASRGITVARFLALVSTMVTKVDHGN